MTPVATMLRAAKELINTEEKWQNEHCIFTSLVHACGHTGTYHEALASLGFRDANKAAKWNDKHTYQEVIALFDATIAKEET